MLIMMGGLPGTGKSTVAQRLADALPAEWLRIDVIEQALRLACGLGDEVGEAGYAAAYAIATSRLRSGRSVIADCVNPLAATRVAWREVAARASGRSVEVELVCSDAAEHRQRVENRTSDIEGLALPAWPAVLARRYEPWTEPHLILDTCRIAPDEAVAAIIEATRDERR